MLHLFSFVFYAVLDWNINNMTSVMKERKPMLYEDLTVAQNLTNKIDHISILSVCVIVVCSSVQVMAMRRFFNRPSVPGC